MKPQLHVSMLNMFFRCPLQFQRRYGARFDIWHEEEIIAPNIALIVGTSIHKSVEKNLRHKMEAGTPIEREAAIECAFDTFNGETQKGYKLSDDEAFDIRTTLKDAVNTATSLAGLHYDRVAPDIIPAAVEQKFVILMDGYPFDLAGTIDLRMDNLVAGRRIMDWKTMRATPPADAANSPQMHLYSLGDYIRDRDEKILAGSPDEPTFPESAGLGCLIKTKTPAYCERIIKPSMQVIKPTMNRIERMMRTIELVQSDKVKLNPCDAEHWGCSAKWCGYHASCEFWSGR